MVTIRDVARKAKVAPSTVSMVINGRGKVSDQTRRRVEAAIGQTNYRPQSVGRPTLGQSSLELPDPKEVTRVDTVNLGVVYARRVVFDGSLCSLGRQWMAGIREVAHATHSHLTLLPAVEDSETDEMFQQAMADGELDGILFIGITSDDGGPYLTRTLEAGLPAVVFNRKPLHDEFSYVAMDNYGAGSNAVDYLVNLGHRRIGVVTLDHPDRRYVMELKAGAEAGLARYDLTAAYRGVLKETASAEQVQQVCREIINQGATGVYVAASDGLVVRCLDAWEAMGVKVPGQLSVVGFEDVGPKSRAGLRPTSVGFDKRLMGREAARMMLELIDRRAEVRNRGLIIATRVIRHDTTAPPPAVD